MAAALPTADAAAVRLMALTLLERRRPAGLIGLVVHYHLLPEDVQALVIGQTNDLFRSIREAASLETGPGPSNALRIIRRSLATKLTYLVTEQLRHGPEPLRVEAGECLAHLSRHATTDGQTGQLPAIGAVEAEFLLAAVEDAVAAFGQHRRLGVLLAMAHLLPRPMPRTFERLGNADEAAVAGLRALLGQVDQAAIRRAIPLLLGLAALREAALQAIATCAQTDRLGEVLEGHHLLLLRATAGALRRVKGGEALLPTDGAVAAMPGAHSRGLPAWLSAVALDRNLRITLLMDLRRAGDAATRLFALRRLVQLAGANADQMVQEAVASFCEDREPTIVRIALWCLIRHRYGGLLKVLTQLVNSSDEEIRRLANRQLAPLGFARLWESWGQLDHGRRTAAGRALIKIDPSFHRLLGEKLLPADRRSRLRALGIITELNQGGFFEQALVRLIREGEAYVAASAVKALASADSDTALSVLEEALEHADGRVRANAVEALAQLQSTRHMHKLVDIADADENRPRANAIAALMDMRTSEALTALRQMLDDPRPNHRNSALWLVETMGLVDVARQVAEMSITDPDQKIKGRAHRVVHEMIDQMSGSGRCQAAEAGASSAEGIQETAGGKTP
jgi:HEAT repeat protein